MPDLSPQERELLDHQSKFAPQVSDLASAIWSTQLPPNARLQIALNIAAELIGKITRRFVGDRLQASISEASAEIQSDSNKSPKEQET